MLRGALLLLALLAVPIASAETAVKVLGGFYEPGTVDVLVGETLVWTNGDAMPHTVTSSWDEGATFDAALAQGETFSTSFAEPGAYTVHCKPHAYFDDETGRWEGMVMAVNVRPLDAPAGIGGAVETPGFAAAFAAVALLAAAALTVRRRRGPQG